MLRVLLLMGSEIFKARSCNILCPIDRQVARAFNSMCESLVYGIGEHRAAFALETKVKTNGERLAALCMYRHGIEGV